MVEEEEEEETVVVEGEEMAEVGEKLLACRLPYDLHSCHFYLDEHYIYHFLLA